jgi:segregation and condensation protein B
MEPSETTRTQTKDEQGDRPEEETGVEVQPDTVETVTAEQLLPLEPETPPDSTADKRLKAVLEAIIYVTEEPLSSVQIATALGEPRDRIEQLLADLAAEYDRPERGLTVHEVAGGYKMATKPEHHETVRAFVKKLKPPLKLSLAALETLAVIAYKQPVTAPEIMEIRGVQGAGVLKTLLDRKLIAAAGRKAVIGKPILYRTTKDFLVQFGLKDLAELPSLKEFEELRRLAVNDAEPDAEPRPEPPAEEADQGPDPPPPEEPGS